MSIQLQEIQSIFISQNRLVEDTRLHQIYTNKLVEGKDYMLGESIKTNDAKNNYILLKNFYPNTDTATANWNKIAVTVGNGEEYFLDSGTGYHFGDCAGCCISTDNKLLLCNHMNGIGHTWNNIALWRIDLSYLERGDMKLILKRQLPKKNSISDIFWSDGSSWKPRNTNWYGNNNTVLSMKLSAPNGFALTDCKFERDNEVYLNLVPCRLLRSIPRNLDAQCKPRVTGECGMIDLISGRFYGNVAESGAFSLEWDEWLKDCTIQFDPETTLGYNTSIPNDYVIYGRIEVAKLTAQFTDFGFMQASNNYIILGESTVYAISDWGTNKWATFVVSYSGGYECSLQLNGVTLTTITSSTPYNQAPHIQLHGIMQLNKIEHTFYPNESDPTQSHSEVWKRFVDQDGRQGLGISDLTYKIYAD